MAAEHVSIVDDDEAVREAVDGLLRSAGLETRAFASAEDFLRSPHRLTTRCLILDLWMPGMAGGAPAEADREWSPIPIIILTANASMTCVPARWRRGGGVPVEAGRRRHPARAVKLALAKQ